MIVISANIKVSPQASTSRLTAEVSLILSKFLYLSFQMLGNPVTSSICCSMVIARSTVGIVRDWLVDVGRDW